MEGFSQDAGHVRLGPGLFALGRGLRPLAAGGQQRRGQKADDEKGNDAGQQRRCPRLRLHTNQDTANRPFCQAKFRYGEQNLAQTL